MYRRVNEKRVNHMTLPVERTQAVVYTEQFLVDLLNPKVTPKVPKAIRERAGSLLKHYPVKYHMDVISEREDNSRCHNQVFSNTYDV